ncbi:MAG: C-GCAxxG-C-C family protein [Selenomonadaceae bacterium]|mgnify:FL=1
MSKNTEKAKAFFDQGANCCQAVVGTFAEKYGLSVETALRLAAGMGGGVQSGEICGVVSGGVMVVGLKYGSGTLDAVAKKQCGEKTKEFINIFCQRQGGITCRNLLGYDLSTAEGQRRKREQPGHAPVCYELVAASVSLLEELGY